MLGLPHMRTTEAYDIKCVWPRFRNREKNGGIILENLRPPLWRRLMESMGRLGKMARQLIKTGTKIISCKMSFTAWHSLSSLFFAFFKLSVSRPPTGKFMCGTIQVRWTTLDTKRLSHVLLLRDWYYFDQIYNRQSITKSVSQLSLYVSTTKIGSQDIIVFT